ncbi:hypothetical protein KTO58_03245 [Chitinophaga pendula]|uniref:hypothetical protein n=1 Tax=Chitinophaga TaxID=79328 RepID=UPI000BAFFA88|nr:MULTISPECIES: hypothetical protein [Chitinophaga]ASZ14149.1 hypothetical protein CK934_25965 [Chitinophaga sp. MD30]UCJ08215.1 hypothetical protein KTO58_03245 [Chitinophaga pendula]
MTIHTYNKIALLLLLLMAGVSSCRKTDFNTIESPAYIRVFNNLDYQITIDTKDIPLPFLTMLVDPEVDANGIPVKAAITGDFLDKRVAWARPYPDGANTTLYQTEYPGSAKVLAGPILNGYDLSSWAQVPAGKHRIMFMSRPLNNTPFFDLSDDLRKIVMIDTVIDLSSREVYTMHILEKDIATKAPGLYIRNESFVRQPISDSLVYVNFYNLSSIGFYERGKVNSDLLNQRIMDTMNVYYTLGRANGDFIPGQQDVLMGAVLRSQDPKVAPYYSFPLFADTTASRIYAGNSFQLFTFLSPAYTPESNPFLHIMGESNGRFSTYAVGPIPAHVSVAHKTLADQLTGMVVTVRSGAYFNRSFATVNTVEFVNGKFYIMTIQRKYEPPVY